MDDMISIDRLSNVHRFVMLKHFPCFPVLLPIIFLLTALVSGCAGAPQAHDSDAMTEYQQANDLAEPTNRVIFYINRCIDTAILKPAAHGYRILPQSMRDSVRNILTNWSEPLVFIHDMLQGEFEHAGSTMARFITNTTIGFIGVGDIASASLDIPHHDEDMGQTLAVWGMSEGPYVMLPLLGPSSVRDALGRLVDFFLDPVSLVVTIPTAANASKMSVEGIDWRERYLDVLDDLERTSLDYYVSLRTLYRQRRAEKISNGRKTVGGGLVGYDEGDLKALSRD